MRDGPASICALGRAAMARGDAATAAASFREAIRLQPDLADARENLGLALYEMGDLDGAVEELRALLRQRPDAVRARYVLATALMAKQDWPAARSGARRRPPPATGSGFGALQPRARALRARRSERGDRGVPPGHFPQPRPTGRAIQPGPRAEADPSRRRGDAGIRGRGARGAPSGAVLRGHRVREGPRRRARHRARDRVVVARGRSGLARGRRRPRRAAADSPRQDPAHAGRAPRDRAGLSRLSNRALERLPGADANRRRRHGRRRAAPAGPRRRGGARADLRGARLQRAGTGAPGRALLSRRSCPDRSLTTRGSWATSRPPRTRGKCEPGSPSRRSTPRGSACRRTPPARSAS